MSKILLIDNYDSFTYNLVQYLEELTSDKVDVVRNDKISLEEVDEYDTIVLSPGPGLPKDAGIMPEVLKKYHSSKKILGVCLGHQAIIEAFGGEIRNLKTVFHGVATKMKQTENKSILFEGVPQEYVAGRYHSWCGIVDKMPEQLEITSVDETGEIMALQHKSLPV